MILVSSISLTVEMPLQGWIDGEYSWPGRERGRIDDSLARVSDVCFCAFYLFSSNVRQCLG